jgi:F-type H+-transporting ATPase subunit gamma
MANLSGLKAEIESISDIGKITGAMELVATAKLRKIQKRALGISEYVTEVYSLFNEIIVNSEKSKYLRSNADGLKKTLYVVVNSNLGLCGGYNSNLNKLVKSEIKNTDEVYAIGTKAVSFCKNNHLKIKRQDLSVDVNFSSEQARQIATDVLALYNSGEFDEVKLAYTKFVNSILMEPVILRIFPIIKVNEAKAEKVETSEAHAPLEFEPDPETVLSSSVSLYLNTIIFGTIIESQLSEQTSRRTAMESATKNGKDLKAMLNLLFNRKRQAAITQEISEIVSGADAQEN